MQWRVAVLMVLSSVCSVNSQSACGADSAIQGGIRYSYHENDCNQYRQCHYNLEKNESVIVYRACGHGEYWNQVLLQCQRKDAVNCPIALFVTASCTTIPLEGSCRSHWRCENRAVNATCCKLGQRFTLSHGCVNDLTCTEPCPGECSDVCRKSPDRFITDRYFKFENLQTYEDTCSRGTHFDVLKCDCVTASTTCSPTASVEFSSFSSIATARSRWLNDANLNIVNNIALFQPNTNVTGNVRIAQPTDDAPLLIKFIFREQFPRTGSRNLLISDDCKGCHSFRIDLISTSFGEAFQVTLLKFGRIVTQITMSTNGFENQNWKRVIVWYTGRELVAVIQSGNITYMKRTRAATLNIMNCGFQFASDRLFNGFMPNFAIYNCNPKGRLVDLLPFFPDPSL